MDESAKLSVLEKIKALMSELDAQQLAGAVPPPADVPGETPEAPPGVDAAVAADPVKEGDEPAAEEATETPAAEAEEDDESDLAKLRALAGKGK